MKSKIIKLTGFMAISLLVFFAFSVQVMAAVTAQFEKVLSMTDQWHFNNPQSVVTDARGYIYVVDTDHHCIQIYNGTQWKAFGEFGSEPGQFYSPGDVAIDSDGSIYVADSGNHRIQKLSSEGAYLDEWGAVGSVGSDVYGEFLYPTGIWLDAGDNMYVLDTGNHRIQKLNPHGEYIQAYGLPEEFRNPIKLIVADNGNFYVTDKGNDRIGVYNGSSWSYIGSFGSGEGKFRGPSDLCLDSSGNLYVADTGNHRIQKLTGDGTFLRAWGKNNGILSRGDAPGEFSAPHGIDIDPWGRVIVADTDNNRIQRLTGSMWEMWDSNGDDEGELTLPLDLAIDVNGDIYVAEDGSDRIQKFTVDGTFVAAWGKNDGTAGTSPGEFNNPSGLIVSHGVLYVADSGNNRLQIYDGVWRVLGGPGSAPGKFSNPSGLSFGWDDDLYVADTGNHRVQKYKDGVWSVVASGLDYPHGVTVTRDGTLYVTDTANDRIVAYGRNGTKVYGGYGAEPGKFIYPVALDQDGQDRLLVLDRGNDRVQILENGKWRALGKPGFRLGEFNSPYGMATAADGTIFVADTDNHRIIKMTLTTIPDPLPGSDGPSAAVPPAGAIEVEVNGIKGDLGGIYTALQVGEQTQAVVQLDEAKVSAFLEGLDEPNPVITISFPGNTHLFTAELTGQMIMAMENKGAVVEIRIPGAEYRIPAGQININALAASFGAEVSLSDIKIRIQVANPTSAQIQAIEDRLTQSGYGVVIPPLEFKVTGTYGDKTIEINRFNTYIERAFAIPGGTDPAKITTGIIVEQDGAVRHVPTRITMKNGQYYAVINSLTNSVYTLIANLTEFSDVTNHWVKETVNDIGSRLVISGVGHNLFEPDRNITRAEFAAILVRGLGLKPGTGGNPFADVEDTAWYCDFVKTAADYRLISGYEDGTFRPMENITREQAMTMIARAMGLTGLKVEFKEGEMEQLLEAFGDPSASAGYAKSSIAACIKTGVVTGRDGNLIAPRDKITRAEVAVIVRRLLQKSDLI